VEFLAGAGMLAVTEAPDGDFLLEATDLGLLTARMMLSCATARELRSTLARMDPPADPDEAERLLIDTVATVIPKLAQTTVSEDLKPAVARLLDAGGRLVGAARPGKDGTGSGSRPAIAPGDTARAALLTVAQSPSAFGANVRQIAGVPYAAMYPVLEEAPRYLNWLGGQGLLGTVHPWCAIVGADLGRRIRWRRCQPRRGASRLLWICEQMATAGYIDDTVELWRAAVARGIVSPDWTTPVRPRHCRLDEAEYSALLRDRATGIMIDLLADRVTARAPSGAALVAWAGRALRLANSRRGEATLAVPDGDRPPDAAAVFTWRGDYHATGWLGIYSQFSS
jgi:helicase